EQKKESPDKKGKKGKSKTTVISSFDVLIEKCKELLEDEFEDEELYDEEREELIARVEKIGETKDKDFDKITKILNVLKGKKLFKRASEFLNSAYEFLSHTSEKKNAPELVLLNAEINEEHIHDYEKSVELYELYLKESSQSTKFVRLHFHIAQLYHLKLENILKSKENYDVIIDSYPESEYFDKSLLFEGMLYMDEYKEYDTAIEYFERIINDKFDSELADDAQYKIGEIYENILHDDQKAKEAYEKVIHNFSNSNVYENAEFAIRRIEDRN
ncbi:tetratricopeptide repeat protein, partial [bacterium]|nr:tetratricopeptide repeat protein [bacterium]